MLTPAKLPSEQRFGLLLVVVFAALGGYGIYGNWGSLIATTFLFASVIIALVALYVHETLAPFNRAWFQISQLLGKVVSPIVIGIIFFGLLTPVAVISRVFGRDELNLKRRNVESDWINRSPLGPAADSFKNQF